MRTGARACLAAAVLACGDPALELDGGRVVDLSLVPLGLAQLREQSDEGLAGPAQQAVQDGGLDRLHVGPLEIHDEEAAGLDLRPCAGAQQREENHHGHQDEQKQAKSPHRHLPALAPRSATATAAAGFRLA